MELSMTSQLRRRVTLVLTWSVGIQSITYERVEADETLHNNASVNMASVAAANVAIYLPRSLVNIFRCVHAHGRSVSAFPSTIATQKAMKYVLALKREGDTQLGSNIFCQIRWTQENHRNFIAASELDSPLTSSSPDQR